MALIYAARGICPSVGYWHSPFAKGPNYLPLLRSNKPIKPFANHRLSKPMPNEMIASKGICEQTLRGIGFPKKKIRLCSALRSFRAIKITNQRKGKPQKRYFQNLNKNNPKVFLACSADPKENLGLIYAFQKALDCLPKTNLIFRPHPACEASKNHLNLFKSNSKITTFRLATDTNFHFDLLGSDALVLGGSSLAFEAIALGVMPVVYESTVAFSACSMKSFGKSLFVVHSAEEMVKGIMASLYQHKTWHLRTKTWSELLRELSLGN